MTYGRGIGSDGYFYLRTLTAPSRRQILREIEHQSDQRAGNELAKRRVLYKEMVRYVHARVGICGIERQAALSTADQANQCVSVRVTKKSIVNPLRSNRRHLEQTRRFQEIFILWTRLVTTKTTQCSAHTPFAYDGETASAVKGPVQTNSQLAVRLCYYWRTQDIMDDE